MGTANALMPLVLPPFDHTPFLSPVSSCPSCAFPGTNARRRKAWKSHSCEEFAALAVDLAMYSVRGGVFVCAWRSSALGERTLFAFAFRVFGNTSGRACEFERLSSLGSVGKQQSKKLISVFVEQDNDGWTGKK